MSKRIQTFLKILITIGAFGFIVWKLIRYENLSETTSLFINQLKHAPFVLLLSVLILMPLNWWLEMKKWRTLILRLHPVTWSQVVKAVLTGLTMALLTPNRIGENFSRVFILPKEKRVAAIGLSGVNTLAQIVIIQLGGILGFLLLINNNQFLNILNSNTGWLTISFGLIISTIIVIIYFKIDKVIPLINSWKIVKKYLESLKILNSLDNRLKWKVLGLAFLKYFVYTFQFYLLLNYFGVIIAWYICIPAIMTIYVLLNYLPVISIGEAGVRGSVTLLIIGQFSDANLSILASSFGLWAINIVIPAVIGGFFMQKVKF